VRRENGTGPPPAPPGPGRAPAGPDLRRRGGRAAKGVAGLVALSLLAPAAGGGPGPARGTGGNGANERFRAVRLDLREVTEPHVAAASDGRSVVFTLLGKLFRVPAEGGAAEQLTFGFGWDSEPAVSPDGARVAFVSDRDGSGGNVFVLDVADGAVTRLTSEVEAGSPRWSPDGTAIAYLRHFRREEAPGDPGYGGAGVMEPKTVPAAGGEARSVAPPAGFGAIFYWPDGRLGWAAPDPKGGGGPFGPRKMLLQALSDDGAVSTLATAADSFGPVVLAPKGDGVYYATGQRVRHWSFEAGKPADLATLKDGAARVAVAAGGAALFYGDRGKLWRVALPGGAPEQVAFEAAASLTLRRRTAPRWTPPSEAAAAPRAVLTPRLSPDGRSVVFMAAGFLYGQTLDGRPARRLFTGAAFERDPAFSPDGRRLAYVAGENGRRELRLYDLETGRTRVLHSVNRSSWVAMPSWSADGRWIVFQQSGLLVEPYRLLCADVDGGEVRELAQTRGSWTARPHFSPDGRTLYFTQRAGKLGEFYRLALEPGAEPERLSALGRNVNDGLVSPDGRWFAFRRNTEIWVAPMSSAPFEDGRMRLAADDCSRSFDFTADSREIVYAAGDRVWRRPVAGGDRVEAPVRLKLPRPVAPPLLVRRVRVLDFEKKGFREEASMLLRDGRVAWIGEEEGRRIPKDAAVLDAAGRYAVPGLIDAHVHSAWANQMADPDNFIAFGNTAVRDVGGSLDLLNALEDRGESTLLPVPRYFYGGEILEGEVPVWGDAFFQIKTEAEARRAVRRLKDWGSQLVKVYFSVPYDLQNAMADEAQKQGLPLAGHAISFEEMARHVLQGYAAVEHTTMVMHEDGRKLLAASGTHWVGTVNCEGGAEIFMREEPPRRLDTDMVRRYVTPEKIAYALKNGRFGSYPKEFWPVNLKSALGRIFAGHREGVEVRAGTDATMAEVFCGLSLHWELELLAMAGLTPFELLRMATAGAAGTVGAERYLGALEPGRLADAVVLDADPLEDIRNTVKVWRVIKAGAVFVPGQAPGE